MKSGCAEGHRSIRLSVDDYILEPVQPMRSDAAGQNQSCDRGNNNQGFVLRQNRELICWLVIRASRYIDILVYDTMQVPHHSGF